MTPGGGTWTTDARGGAGGGAATGGGTAAGAAGRGAAIPTRDDGCLNGRARCRGGPDFWCSSIRGHGGRLASLAALTTFTVLVAPLPLLALGCRRRWGTGRNGRGGS